MHEVLTNIKKIRIDLRLSQEYMGNHLGMTQANYGKFENGRNKTLDVHRLEEIAQIFEMDVVDLFTYHSDSYSTNKKPQNYNDVDESATYQGKVSKIEKEITTLDYRIHSLESKVDLLLDLLKQK